MMENDGTRVFRPATLEEALRHKADYGEHGRFVAGGTDMVLQALAGRHRPRAFIRLPAAANLPVENEGAVTICALTPLRLVERSELVREKLPLLATAFSQIGSPLIRNLGTLGGNLGNASPAADSAPPLLVYGAALRLASVRGVRVLPVQDFFLGPGRTALAQDEAIIEALLPLPGEDELTVFRKFGPRGANVISSANFAARLALPNGEVSMAALAAGSVAPRPKRLPRTEAAVTGLTTAQFGDEAVVQNIVAVLRQEIAPIDDVRGSAWYKGRVVELCVRHLAALAAGREEK